MDDDKIVLFWGMDSPFSQFYPCEFKVKGQQYTCAEQYFMYQKAVLFQDVCTARKILSERHPCKIKHLGRSVKNFDDNVWDTNKRQIAEEGNYAKFKQNKTLRKILLDTENKLLAEASMYDKIWGIGFSMNHPYARRPDKWSGENLLGECLFKVRKRLQMEKKVRRGKICFEIKDISIFVVSGSYGTSTSSRLFKKTIQVSATTSNILCYRT